MAGEYYPPFLWERANYEVSATPGALVSGTEANVGVGFYPDAVAIIPDRAPTYSELTYGRPPEPNPEIRRMVDEAVARVLENQQMALEAEIQRVMKGEPLRKHKSKPWDICDTFIL
jgi:hypothetical protein